AQDLNVIEEVIRMMLEIINSCLSNSLHHNPNLVYALLYKRELFEQFRSHPSFQDIMQNLDTVIGFFSGRLEQAGTDLSVERVQEVIKKGAVALPRDRLKWPRPDCPYSVCHPSPPGKDNGTTEVQPASLSASSPGPFSPSFNLNINRDRAVLLLGLSGSTTFSNSASGIYCLASAAVFWALTVRRLGRTSLRAQSLSAEAQGVLGARPGMSDARLSAAQRAPEASRGQKDVVFWDEPKFPELKFKYVEEDQPEDFFIPYVWSLVFNSG
ncbi:hypothetical protein JZ751_012262, partial [Albula glossodonta]